MTTTLVVWLSFTTGIVGLIFLDLKVFHQKPAESTTREALTYWVGWVVLAAVFNVYIYFLYENNWLGWGVSSRLDLNGRDAALQFMTGYLIELSLSIDNVFVIIATCR